MSDQFPNLFTPLKLGAVELPNRFVMAPLTRARTEQDHIPNELMVEHYAQRASAGLLIAEATMAMEGCSAFWKEPGIYSEAQIEGWQKVTQAVHDKGGRIFVQVWHGGRACHPDLNNGRTPVAPSAIAITNADVHTPNGKQAYTLPRALQTAEIPAIVAGFKQAAINAVKAGFDGIEIHAANGYLIDEFLRDGSNKREDEYGGSLENRSRLLFEILDACMSVIDEQRIGIRISPINSFNSMRDSDPCGLTQYLCERLNQYDLAYLHIMRSDFYGEQTEDVLSVAQKVYQGNLITNMGYSAEEAEAEIATGNSAAVAFGVPFIANPDLPERIAANAELNQADPDTFYTPGAKGYNDYPFMSV
ncbi:alkene reductase [Thiomicrorhabdus sediminis]|uniref:Alkene reductase n=1 Tax=Thiomicrorhabdus sediminis TaxID=2580412 RepID=A0A4P9K6G7_9GAMM|nr:alkene reductase [Thiomicrorhabdus sediminis]QCU89906.1 alkene reductase [Thiomicrorhabdus sediminis]